METGEEVRDLGYGHDGPWAHVDGEVLLHRDLDGRGRGRGGMVRGGGRGGGGGRRGHCQVRRGGGGGLVVVVVVGGVSGGGKVRVRWRGLGDAHMDRWVELLNGGKKKKQSERERRRMD